MSKKHPKTREFFLNIVRGMALGVSAIIPGVSAGTLAVLMGIYDKLINAISSIRKEFKKSISFLLPIVLGAGLGIAILSFLINYAFRHFPLPTILFFAGLMLGTCPKIFRQGLDNGFKKTDIACVILPAVLVAAIAAFTYYFTTQSADLSESMTPLEYVFLFLVGACASGALIIPGISGAMLLLAFGYYEVVLSTFYSLGTYTSHALLVIAVFILGVVCGLFTVSKVIRLLLNKFERGTYWSIIGFVIGSFPALYFSFASNYPDAAVDYKMVIAGVAACILGAIITLTLVKVFAALEKKNAESAAPTAESTAADGNET